jgi:spore germination cell wall hydrolase CwlJ-like protein
VFPKPVKNPVARSCALFLTFAVAGCTQSAGVLEEFATSSTHSTTSGYSARDKECMARAIFFESHRSSREGMLAVGTVVMNRVKSPNYPNTVCGVVGQKNQFAPGVMSRAMNSRALPDVQAAASSVLRGERHPKVHSAKFFHQAGLTFPYRNMHYVLEAGGNAFYERR